MSFLCTLLAIGCASISGAAYTIDGDTLSIDYQHVRLAGIDAEELDEPHGPAARDHLILLAHGRRVTCKLNGETSYNRKVGVCFAGSVNLNAAMVRDGYALDCAHYSKGLYATLEPSGIRSKLKQKGYCR